MFHFAGHAVTNVLNPDESYLALLDDQRRPLTAAAIGALALPELRLAVLAACEGLGARSFRTQGSMSLARAFLQAGVPTVVANRWPVDDGSSGAFVVKFHESFRAGGDAAAALRQAQLAMLGSDDARLRDPSTWAGWAVVGGLEPRATHRTSNAELHDGRK